MIIKTIEKKHISSYFSQYWLPQSRKLTFLILHGVPSYHILYFKIDILLMIFRWKDLWSDLKSLKTAPQSIKFFSNKSFLKEFNFVILFWCAFCILIKKKILTAIWQPLGQLWTNIDQDFLRNLITCIKKILFILSFDDQQICAFSCHGY